jgi:hypothetical protein
MKKNKITLLERRLVDLHQPDVDQVAADVHRDDGEQGFEQARLTVIV